ncbi:MAG: hypothetical protein ACK459_07815 [Akkermansiaceae bacterium]
MNDPKALARIDCPNSRCLFLLRNGRVASPAAKISKATAGQ